MILEARLQQDFGTNTDGRITIEFLDRPDSYLITATAQFTLETPLHEWHTISPYGFEESKFGDDAGWLTYSAFPALLMNIEFLLNFSFVLPRKYPFRRRKSSKASPYLPRCYRPVGPWYRIPPEVELDPTCEATLVLWKRNLVDVPFAEIFADVASSPQLGDDRVVRIPRPEG